MTDEHVHPQNESKLLSLPAEVRQAIYYQIFHDQTHAFLSQGRIHLSACLQPNLGDDYHDGSDRKTAGESCRGSTRWARRLGSSWGPHWECEEAAHAEKTDLKKHCCNHVCDLFFVCKKIFFDIRDLIVETTAINVTDLDTLGAWLRKSNELNGGLDCHRNLWEHIHFNIQEGEGLIPRAGFDATVESIQCGTWNSLWPAVCQLPKLCSLYIWLDHNDVPSWSFVNERLALRPVIAAITSRRKHPSGEGSLQRMDITFNLPKLHPRFATPDTHFQEGLPQPFTIERRIRQRHHYEELPDGSVRAAYKADFPVLQQLPEIIIDDAERNKRTDMASEEVELTEEEEEELRWSLKEVEFFEKEIWEKGGNAYDVMGGPSNFDDEDSIYMRRFSNVPVHGVV